MQLYHFILNSILLNSPILKPDPFRQLRVVSSGDPEITGRTALTALTNRNTLALVWGYDILCSVTNDSCP